MDSKVKKYLIHIVLFIVTVITTTLAGVEWMYGKFLLYGEERTSWDDFLFGFQFSIPFLLILTFHEFGHYFTARYHQIKTTLPYYLPLWFGFLALPSLGTMGAFIRIKSLIHSRKEYFDVGVSGPLAGFVIIIGVMIYGYRTLPPTEYIYEIHPEYEVFGENFEERMEGLDTLILKADLNPARQGYKLLSDTIHINDPNSPTVHFGDNIMMYLSRKYLAPDDRYIPSSKELMHYPWLFAAYLALFFTALNLLPIGQLDGGHVIFSLFGEKQSRWISRVVFTGFLFYAGLGWITTDLLVDTSNGAVLSFVFGVLIYVYFLYLSTTSMFPVRRDRFVFAGLMFTVQFLVYEITSIEGYPGWILFAFFLGRFLGVYHPKVSDNRPLNPVRKVIAWIAIIVFIISFSPRPLIIA